MSTDSRDNLKSYFQNGDRPTEMQFAQLIDETVNKNDDKATDSEAEDSTIEDKFITPKTAEKSVKKFAPVKKVNGVVPDVLTGDVVIDLSDIQGLETILNNLENNKQNLLNSGTTIKTINGESLLGSGNIEVIQTGSKNAFSTDFLISLSGQQGMFGGIAVSAGTTGSGSFEQNHPGVIVLKKSTTVNSGYTFAIANQLVKMYAGLYSNLVFKTFSTQATRTIRYGFQDSNGNGQPSNGVYFEIIDGNITANTVTSTVKTTVVLSTLNNSSWYHLRVSIISINECKFEVYNDSGTLIHNENITTNIPSVALNCNVVGLGSSAIVENIVSLDYIDINLGNLQRGNL